MYVIHTKAMHRFQYQRWLEWGFVFDRLFVFFVVVFNKRKTSNWDSAKLGSLLDEK